MKYLLCHIFVLLVLGCYSQNVHIISSTNSPFYLDGPTPVFNSIYENGIFRGYFGSFGGDPLDIDFGTAVNNLEGKLHLTTIGIPRLTIGVDGNVGIGTASALERMTIHNGNLKMLNSNRGIILNAANKPLITRGWDPFTSGANNGLGRWGVFMEVNRLVIGIPNLANKGIEFSGYKINSTRDTLLTIQSDGKIKRPAQGNVDLLPIAMGNVRLDGIVQEGTGNFQVVRVGIGNWEITLDNEPYNLTNYAVLATVAEYVSTPSFISTYPIPNPNRIGVFINSSNGSFIDQNFHFIVYKFN